MILRLFKIKILLKSNNSNNFQLRNFLSNQLMKIKSPINLNLVLKFQKQALPQREIRIFLILPILILDKETF